MITAAARMVGPMWLTVTYLLQTLGELCLSPVGLSAMTKLAPDRAAGFMMGIWFLSISIGRLARRRRRHRSTVRCPSPELFGIGGRIQPRSSVGASGVGQNRPSSSWAA